VLEYRWGERANLEVKKSGILMNACKSYKCEPLAFAQQYEQVSLTDLKAMVVFVGASPFVNFSSTTTNQTLR
jgi:hypothetical protein